MFTEKLQPKVDSWGDLSLDLSFHSRSIQFVGLLLNISIVNYLIPLCILAFVGVFYYLPNVNDFIVEILIGSVNSQVMNACFVVLNQIYVIIYYIQLYSLIV